MILHVPNWFAEYMQDDFIPDEISYWLVKKSQSNSHTYEELVVKVNDLYDLLRDIRANFNAWHPGHKHDLDELEAERKANLETLKKKMLKLSEDEPDKDDSPPEDVD